MPISEEEWKELKAKESYGMYVELHNKIKEIRERDRESFKRVLEVEDQIDKITEENYALSKRTVELGAALSEIKARVEKLEQRR